MLFTDKCQNFATDRILEAAFYIDTERGNYMKTIVVCDDVEIERLLLKEILCQYFEEINEEVSIVEYDSGETLVADVEEKEKALSLLMKQQTGKDFTFDEKLVSIVNVIRIDVKEFTAKERKLPATMQQEQRL